MVDGGLTGCPGCRICRIFSDKLRSKRDNIFTYNANFIREVNVDVEVDAAKEKRSSIFW